MDNVFDRVEKNIDALVRESVDWSACATQEALDKAALGELLLPFYDDFVPQEWLGEVAGKCVLCLAGAGGLQGPIFAAAGAEVTVLDLSDAMLALDRQMMEKTGLFYRLEKGNMCDLSRFGEETFDLIFNPPSLMYVPDLAPVYRECARVLKKGGVFIVEGPCPVNYLCNVVEGRYVAENRMPYDSSQVAPDSTWVEYGHTMESYLGGLLRAGFVLTHYQECQRVDITELFFAARAERI